MELSIGVEMEIGKGEIEERAWDSVRLAVIDQGYDNVYIKLGETFIRVRRQDLIGLAANILIGVVIRGGEKVTIG